MASEILYC